jgi:hypothetical protein
MLKIIDIFNKNPQTKRYHKDITRSRSNSYGKIRNGNWFYKRANAGIIADALNLLLQCDDTGIIGMPYCSW